MKIYFYSSAVSRDYMETETMLVWLTFLLFFVGLVVRVETKLAITIHLRVLTQKSQAVKEGNCKLNNNKLHFNVG